MKINNIIHKFGNLITLYLKGGVSYAKKLGVTVGENSRILTTNFGTEPFLVSIGNNVTITSGVKFITHDGTTWLMRDEKGRRYYYQKICVGNNVFVGVNSIILPGVQIDDNVIVAAGSVVTKSVPSGVIVAGVPAKIIGNYKDIKKRMLDNYISDENMDLELSYEDRILKVVTKGYKDYLSNERQITIN